MREAPFKVFGQAVFFEKASAPQGKRRRIAGIISTETRDRQQEIIVQKGLDFEPFISYGWFNDNHSKATDGVVGYPTEVKTFNKGDALPNGTIAKSNCTWAEGYCIEGTERADNIWQLGQALSKSGSGRGLGFSIEGTVHKRTGPGKRIVAKATVQNCAITNCPVNPDTRMEMLAKSLTAIQTGHDIPNYVQKAMSMGTPGPGGAEPTGPVTGEGAGQVVSPESLEHDLKDLKKKKKKKKLSKSEAFELLRAQLPSRVTDSEVRRVIDLAISMGRRPAA